MPPSNRKFQKQQKINTYLELLANLRLNKNKYSYSNSKLKSKPKPKNRQIIKKKRSKHDQELYERIEMKLYHQI